MKCETCGEIRREYRNPRKPRDCGLVTLALSRSARIRKKLRDVILRSTLPIVVFGEWVLGRDPRTIQRWLSGEKIPEAAAVWIDRLELVQLQGSRLVVVLKWEEARPRWRYFQAQKKRIIYRSAEA